MAGIKKVLDIAEASAKAGDLARAVSLYRQILTKVPRHSKAKKALARLERQGGDAGQMTQVEAQTLLQILNTGNFAAAQISAKQLSQRFPNEPFVFNILGYVSGLLGDEKAAVAAYEWAIKLNPNFAEAMSNYGAYLVQKGKLDEAVEILTKALKKKPDYAEAHHNLGLALSRIKDIKQSLKHFDKAVSIDPKYVNALNSRGSLYKQMGQLALALKDFKTALRLSPNDQVVKENLCSILEELGYVDQSLKLTEELLTQDPENLAFTRRKAVQLNALGRKPEAIDGFKEILKLRSNDGEAMGNLLEMLPEDQRIPLRQEAIELANKKDVEAYDLVRLSFALAADAERNKDHEKTGFWLNSANATYRNSLQPPPILDETRFAQARLFFKNGTPESLKEAGNSSQRPIFVVGLMRSGTSLVEQIISSHSEVFGAGELNSVTDLGSEIMAFGPNVSAQAISEFANDYLSILDAVDVVAPRTVDKMPANFFFVGLLKTAFPNARIINTVRDPRDTCFSIWKNFFDTQAHQYAYDQIELAHFANEYRSLMAFWDELFPNAVYHVCYEDLVADQEGQSRKLLDHLELPWESQVLEFYKNKRAVRTASVNQVREKMYTSSVKSWEPHKDHLRVLFDGLDCDLWADGMLG